MSENAARVSTIGVIEDWIVNRQDRLRLAKNTKTVVDAGGQVRWRTRRRGQETMRIAAAQVTSVGGVARWSCHAPVSSETHLVWYPLGETPSPMDVPPRPR